MTNKQFKAWRKRLGFSQTDAALALDISKRMIGYYDNGFKIPTAVSLACRYLESLQTAQLAEMLQRARIGR